MTFPWPRLLVTAGALLPYWRLLAFNVIYVTDDYFTSDIFNGELPGRALIGQLLRRGEWPVWTSQLCSGIPLSGSPADPIGLALFTALPPAPALDLYVIVLLLIAAHGAYGLARRFGADAAGAILAGLAFAGSGYIAAQLKHLAIIATIVWLPVGLLSIDRVLAPEDGPAARMSRRVLWGGLFGLVFAQQVLAGFPQSAYICALVYGTFALFRALNARRLLGGAYGWAALLGVLAVAVILGALAGAVVLLPLSHVGALSDRAEALGYEWATRLAYSPSNWVMFLFPYANGDISNNTYTGTSLFWEDYGYVGFFTFLLAIYGAVRERTRPLVLFVVVTTLVAMLFVLGRATPVYEVAYLVIPGLKLFRFPTRFLIVVDLGLALLAAIGLTRFGRDLQRRWPSSVTARIVAPALCAVTAVDLFVHQPRQNPIVPAREWLTPPASAELIRAATPQPRTFSPRHNVLHRLTFVRAQGWADVQPYLEVRDLLEPNTGGGFWNVASADCYAAIGPRWQIDVWGDHNRSGSVISLLAALDFKTGDLRVDPRFPVLLKTFGVTHVLSPYPQDGSALPFVARAGYAYVYRIDGAARVRVVRSARVVASDDDAVRRLLAPDFDPDREILLHDAPADAASHIEAGDRGPGAAGRAAIRSEDSRQIVIDAETPRDAFLLLADTFYPGWTVQVDGQPTPLYRADMAVRGIALPRGRHEVRFSYEPAGVARGAWISAASIAVLLLWAGAAAYVDRRAR